MGNLLRSVPLTSLSVFLDSPFLQGVSTALLHRSSHTRFFLAVFAWCSSLPIVPSVEYSDWVRLSADVPPIGGLPLVMPGIILDRCRTYSVLHHSYILGGVLCFVRLQAFLYLNLLHTDALSSLFAAPYDVGHSNVLCSASHWPLLFGNLFACSSWCPSCSCYLPLRAVRGKHSSPLRLFRLPCLPRLRLVVQFSSLTLLILGLKLVACLLLRSSSCEHESCHLLPSLDCVALLRWVLPSFSMSVFGHLFNFTIIRFTAPCSADFCFCPLFHWASLLTASVRFPSCVLSVGVILHALVSGVLTLLTLLFLFPLRR